MSKSIFTQSQIIDKANLKYVKGIDNDGNDCLSTSTRGSDNVQVIADYSEGTKLATIIVDGSPTQIYTPDTSEMDWSTKLETTLYWNTTTNETNITSATSGEYYIASRNEIVYLSAWITTTNDTNTFELVTKVIPSGLNKSDSIKLYDNHLEKQFTAPSSNYFGNDADQVIILNKGDKLYLSAEKDIAEDPIINSGGVKLVSFEFHGIGGTGYEGSGGGAVVPDYSKYSPSIHDIVASDITTYGNESSSDVDIGYDKIVPKSKFNNKYFTATEDCFVFPLAYAYTTTVDGAPGPCYPLAIYVGESSSSTNMFRVFSSDIPYGDMMSSWNILLKKGQILAIWSGGNSSDGSSSSDVENNRSYWLPVQQLNPQVAFPNWDISKKIDINPTPTLGNEWTAPDNGYIRFSAQPVATPSGSANHYVKMWINGIEVSYVVGDSVYNPAGVNVVPVSKGDKIYFTNVGEIAHQVTQFYPAKAVVQDANSIIELLYPVGSIYLDGNNNNTCPLAAVITGSTWSKIEGRYILGSGQLNGGTSSETYTAGATVDPGLPNITGSIKGMDTYPEGGSSTGAFTTSNYSQELGAGGAGYHSEFSFDASQSSSIYGQSASVRPPAYVVNIWKRVS